jgi:Response regulator of the LytR/AlgR family
VINITICEDDIIQAEYLKALITNGNFPAEITVFDSAESFKSAQNIATDILLLDIQMGGQNGFELAKELRAADKKMVIIFITAIADYIHDGYDVSALHYLLKPVNETKFHEILTKAYESVNSPEKSLIIHSDNKDINVAFGNILYIEAFRNSSVIVTADAVYEVRQNISGIEKELDTGFFRCQRSFIVSLKHIRHISKTEVLLTNGKAISLSRNIYEALYRAFINYFKNERGVK